MTETRMQNNKMRTCLCILCVAAAALLSSCSKTPKGVIPEKDMAVLLADMAEARRRGGAEQV